LRWGYLWHLLPIPFFWSLKLKNYQKKDWIEDFNEFT
jgi:hypothetical protein